ncbi:MAG: hypothetical protein ACTHK2_14580 [Dokdonella sp.]|uniref:hypothetical protein n=1 Tax=Dokdonella sp. TaxID=2291710 RepID=UPI003F7F2824
MHRTSLRSFGFLLFAASFAAAPFAGAQVTINLTTTQQTNCTAVTDAQGLSLVPGSTNLAATGVTLTGAGCGAAPSDFAAAISGVPSTIVAGTPFNVTWSAAAAATQCVFGGSTGLTNWPTGTVACTGAACAGSHPVNGVTVPAAGNYSMSVTCTNSTGYAQGGGTATAPQQPPQPANFALTPSANPATINIPFSVSWNVTGATSCTGTASLDGSSVNLPGWTDVTTTASPRTVTASVAGGYTLGMTCSNAQGSVSSAPLALTVTGDTGGCPAGRQTTADVCYSYGLGSSCAAGADVTQFTSIWGRNAAGGPMIAFPGYQEFAVFKNLDKTKYIAAKIDVPLTGLDPVMSGIITHGETYPGPALTVAISPTCGDFSPTTSICLTTGTTGGQIAGKWKLPTATQTNGCVITPGQSYYINIKATNPAQTSSDCSGNICKVTVQSNHTP